MNAMAALSVINPNLKLVAYLTALQRDPTMGALYTRLMSFWRDTGGHEMGMFGSANNTSIFGAWGIKEHWAEDSPGLNPKWDAWTAFMANNPKWW